MATSGSELTSCVVDLTASDDKTDVDTEFINPDSDCREKPQFRRRTKHLVQREFQCANSSTNGCSLNILRPVQRETLSPTAVFGRLPFLTAQMLTAVKWLKLNMP